MDKLLIAQKLESLRRCAALIETRIPPTPEHLQADLIAQDILSLNLTQLLGESC